MKENHHKPSDQHSKASANTKKSSTKNEDQITSFQDNRPEAIVQRQFQDLANKSEQQQWGLNIQEMVNNSPRMVAQRQSLEEGFGITPPEQPINNPVQLKENNNNLPENIKANEEPVQAKLKGQSNGGRGIIQKEDGPGDGTSDTFPGEQQQASGQQAQDTEANEGTTRALAAIRQRAEAMWANTAADIARNKILALDAQINLIQTKIAHSQTTGTEEEELINLFLEKHKAQRIIENPAEEGRRLYEENSKKHEQEEPTEQIAAPSELDETGAVSPPSEEPTSLLAQQAIEEQRKAALIREKREYAEQVVASTNEKPKMRPRSGAILSPISNATTVSPPTDTVGATTDTAGVVTNYFGTGLSGPTIFGQTEQAKYSETFARGGGFSPYATGAAGAISTGTNLFTGALAAKELVDGEYLEKRAQHKELESQLNDGNVQLHAAVQILEKEKNEALKSDAENIAKVGISINGVINAITTFIGSFSKFANSSANIFINGITFSVGAALGAIMGTINGIRDSYNAHKRRIRKGATSDLLNFTDKLAASYKEDIDNLGERIKSIEDIELLIGEIAIMDHLKNKWEVVSKMHMGLTVSMRKQGYRGKSGTAALGFLGAAGGAALFAATLGIGAAAALVTPIGWSLAGVAAVGLLIYSIGKTVKRSIRDSNVRRMREERRLILERLDKGAISVEDDWHRKDFQTKEKKGWFNRLLTRIDRGFTTKRARLSGKISIKGRLKMLDKYLEKYDIAAAGDAAYEGILAALVGDAGGDKVQVKDDGSEITFKEAVQDMLKALGLNPEGIVASMNGDEDAQLNARKLVLGKMRLLPSSGQSEQVENPPQIPAPPPSSTDSSDSQDTVSVLEPEGDQLGDSARSGSLSRSGTRDSQAGDRENGGESFKAMIKRAVATPASQGGCWGTQEIIILLLHRWGIIIDENNHVEQAPNHFNVVINGQAELLPLDGECAFRATAKLINAKNEGDPVTIATLRTQASQLLEGSQGTFNEFVQLISDEYLNAQQEGREPAGVGGPNGIIAQWYNQNT